MPGLFISVLRSAEDMSTAEVIEVPDEPTQQVGREEKVWGRQQDSPAETETECVEEFSVSPVRLNCSAGNSVSVCVSEYPMRNTGWCIIYQTAVSFVLLFTLQARFGANREQPAEWQPPKQ